MLPFTHAQFLEVFSTYNQAVWPSQFLAYLLAAAMLASLLLSSSRLRGRLITGGLAVMWLWTGIAYHWLHFTAINNAAWAFGSFFVLQGLLLAYGCARGSLSFEPNIRGLRRWIGWGLIAYATVIYPLLGMAFGPGYPQMPMFGITPCPVTLFTFGVLLLASSRVSPWLLVVPVIWSLVGGSAAFLLHVPQDWLLLLSGASAFFILRNTRSAVLCPQGQH